MHNLKHRAILGALCRLARERAQCEPSESENKTNDGNGCNYIYIWPCSHLAHKVTPFSISLPCLSPFNSLWKTAIRSASRLFFHLSRCPSWSVLPSVSVQTIEERSYLSSANLSVRDSYQTELMDGHPPSTWLIFKFEMICVEIHGHGSDLNQGTWTSSAWTELSCWVK